MKRITLAMLLVAAATTAVAQDPTPPARPARPPVAPQPAPTPRPAAAPVPMRLWDPMDRLDQEALRDMAREAQRASMDAQREANEAMREAQRELMDAQRGAQREAMDAQREAMRDAAREVDRVALNFGSGFGSGIGIGKGIAPMALTPIPPMPPMPAMAPFDAPMARSAFLLDSRSDAFREHAPPPPWAQGDPADSLYRIARDAFNSGDYGRSARLFAEVSQKYPTSNYKNDAPYYEALSRYKIGTTEELRAAAKVLEPLVAKIPSSTSSTQTSTTTTTTVSRPGSPAGYTYSTIKRNATDSEVATLYNRINGALAQRGDRDAADKIAKAASQAGTTACDQEDVAVKTEALNALSQMDPATALPILRKVLDRKDDCSASLRNNAVFMLGRRNDTASAGILLAVAKSDPSVSVRSSAISYLTRIPGDGGLAALEDLLRTEQDERIQRSVVRSLMQSDNPKARASMRALIDRKDAPVNLRIEAINSYNSDRVTADDAAYLRNLYGKAESDQMKRAIIDAVSRIGGAENDQWVLNVAKNTNETSSLRATALSRLSRSTSSTSIADISKLYDASDSQNIRQQIINILSNRKEPEATDKLIDIAKTSTDYQMRKQALQALMRKNDPRTEKILTDILAGEKKP